MWTVLITTKDFADFPILCPSMTINPPDSDQYGEFIFEKVAMRIKQIQKGSFTQTK